MKKSLCIVLSALMIAVSFAACGKKIVNENTTTKVDENGAAYIEVTDKDGKTVTSVLSDKEKSEVEKQAEKSNAKTTTIAASEAMSKIEQEMSGLTDFSEDDLKSNEKDLVDKGTEIKKTTLRDDVIVKALESGKFTLNMTLKAASNADTPVVLVSNGDKIAADMTMNGSKVRMIIDNDGVYVVLPTAKMYVKMSSDEIGNMDELKNIASSDGTYVGSTKVKINGEDHTCEEYKSSDGTVIKYYFNSKKEWKRMEVITEDEVAIYEISSFSNKADESMFSLNGYADMSALLGQMDMGTTTKKK
ncbi:MAG: hypothetical protein PUJ59_06230 [Clostridiaceae bacterium]|nr:hypothetical protein [Clostridiaceae bacterium]MDY5889868.1 hypothetical protein [Oscillospiraceae bacterium]